MARRFTHFVIFAEMRTGSNFLEQNVNQFDDLECYGELYNPHFISGPNKPDLFGYGLREREKDPEGLLTKLIEADPAVIPGFRFFNDHDPRILKKCLNDPACAKVILTRNVLDSYVSRKIAAATNQWKLTNIKHQKSAQITFDLAEFEQHLDQTQDFQLAVLNGLQTTGQTAFYINYDDIHSLEVLNGLARFLGSTHQATHLKKNLKRQNPEPLKTKVENFDEMVAGLQTLDFLNLSRAPTFEPRRGAGVPQFVASDQARLLYIPVQGGPVRQVTTWLAAHQPKGEAGLTVGFNQKSLRKWREDHQGFQSFTVIRHPVARAYHTFCQNILPPPNGQMKDIRETLRREYGVAVPEDGKVSEPYGAAEHKAAFLAFLKFVKANLSDQTSVKVDASWASQTAILEAAAGITIPMHIVPEAMLEKSLSYIEDLQGLKHHLPDPDAIETAPFDLAGVYDQAIEDRVRDIYTRDYLNFGFSDWRGI